MFRLHALEEVGRTIADVGEMLIANWLSSTLHLTTEAPTWFLLARPDGQILADAMGSLCSSVSG